jgi:hypothetical protein
MNNKTIIKKVPQSSKPGSLNALVFDTPIRANFILGVWGVMRQMREAMG